MYAQNSNLHVYFISNIFYFNLICVLFIFLKIISGKFLYCTVKKILDIRYYKSQKLEYILVQITTCLDILFVTRKGQPWKNFEILWLLATKQVIKE